MSRLETLYQKTSEACFTVHSVPEGLCPECAKLFSMMALGVTLDELCKKYFKLRLVRGKIESELEKFWIGEIENGAGIEKGSGK